MGEVGRRRRRWPVVLLAFVVVVATALVAGDFAARYATQDAIAANVKKSTHSDGATVTISSFPFLYTVAAQGRLDRVSITDRGVPVGPIRLDQVRLVASQVRFDRHQLLSNRSVHLTGIQSATVTVDAHLSSLAGTIAHDLGLQVSSTGSDRVAVSAGGVTLATINLTKVPIIPDCPLRIAHSGDTYTFSCTVSPVPSSVLAALSKGQKL